MRIINYFTPSSQSRTKLTIACLLLNYLIVMYGAYKGADLSDLGTGLALLNSPLYVYVLGQSIRPSKIDDNEKIKNPTVDN